MHGHLLSFSNLIWYLILKNNLIDICLLWELFYKVCDDIFLIFHFNCQNFLLCRKSIIWTSCTTFFSCVVNDTDGSTQWGLTKFIPFCSKYLQMHFYPRPILAFGYCHCLHLCVCVCVYPPACLPVRPSLCPSVCPSPRQYVHVYVNYLLVCLITPDLFKRRSLNLVQRCKRPCYRTLSFCGMIELDLQGQI